MKQSAQRDYLAAGLTGLLALGLYLRTLAPGVLDGDSGEFQFAAWLGSLPHPTGYPLFVMLGYAWTHLLPWRDPAWRMNLLTACCAALAVSLVYLLALRLLRAVQAGGATAAAAGAYRLPAFAVAATFAVSATFWSQAVITEVYALQVALLAGILLALVAWGDQPTAAGAAPRFAPLYIAAALLGLGLAHHRATLLLGPAVLLYLALTRPAGLGWSAYFGRLARLLPLVALPLLLYLYIPLAAPQTPYARLVLAPGQVLQLYQPTLTGFWQYVTGQVFETAFRTPAGAAGQLPGAAMRLWHELTGPALALALAGLLWLAWRRAWAFVALTTVYAAAVLVFNLFYGIGDIYVYYIPLYLLACLWLGPGILAAGSLWRRAAAPIAINVAAALALAFPVYLLLTNYAATDRSAATEAGTAARALLAQPLPEGAIVVTNDRDEMMPVWYEQYVAGVRPDVTGLFPLIVPAPAWADVGGVLQGALASGRPVFLIKPMPGLEVKYRLAGEGSLVRVAGPAGTQAPAHPRAIAFGEIVQLRGYDVEPAMVQAGDAMLAVTLYWQPQTRLDQDYTTFVHLVDADGVVVAQDDHRAGGLYYPTTLWQPGDILEDRHALRLAAATGRSPYRIVAGLYRLAPGVQNLGTPQAIGYLAAAQPSAQLAAPAASAAVSYGGQLALVGKEVTVAADHLALHLYWQAQVAPDHDYTLFVHVVDAAGKIVAQEDTPPALPATAWPAGFIWAQDFSISRPAGLAAGRYRLEFGAYDPDTLAALPAALSAGRAATIMVDW